MKKLTFGITFLAIAALMLLANRTPEAFHSGGVAECAGCHSMHAPGANGLGASFLLVGTDQSSTCLTCHQNTGDTGPSGYHVSTIDAKLTAGLSPLQRTPGGDFAWVKKSYNYTNAEGVATIEDGATHGHNVKAVDFGYVVDPTNATAPGSGGAISSAGLGCQSCHDPHSPARRMSNGTYVSGTTLGLATAPIIGSGSYNNSAVPASGQAVGVYRLLRGMGATHDGATFNGVAIAVAPSTYNQTEATNQVRVAYGASAGNTWGAWCGSCHADMHRHDDHITHPVDQELDGEIVNQYNAYVKSGDLSGGSATSFSSLVPFIEGTDSITTLASHARNNNGYLTGPSSSDQVSCLSCHRAHASGMMYGLRFDVEYEFMTKGGNYIGSDNPLVTGSRAGVQHRGRTNAEWQAAYYDRPATTFATYQRVLCNKCHAKD
jgi:hypothetical protein